MIEDIKKFISKYKFNQGKMTSEKMEFRVALLEEEFDETIAAYDNGNPEEFVDGHIDLIVIAIGNLQLAGVDVQKAWDEVMRANMSKVRGIKKGREQSGGFDVTKPEGWTPPSHEGNHGILDEVF